MQKVIYLSPVSFFKGGAERSLFDLMNNPNIRPILVAPDEGEVADKARSLGIETHILPFKSINTIHRPFSFMKGVTVLKDLFEAARALKKLAKDKNVKIVHSNGLKAHAINCAAKLIGGAKAVLHIRDIPYTRSEKAVWEILRRMSDHFVVVSPACWPGESLPKKVSVIYNGTPLIDAQAATPAEKNDRAALQIGFIGRIHPAKGLHLLIDWIAAARAKGRAVTLSVRGTFSEDAPGYEAEIKQKISDLKLEDYVEFTGFIGDSVALYRGIDLTAVPSATPDPLPRSVMESMARGIPVIGSPAGGIGEMIIDYKTGFMVKNAADFQKALAFIEENPEELGNITRNAKSRIESEFSLPRLHDKVSALYAAYA